MKLEECIPNMCRLCEELAAAEDIKTALSILARNIAELLQAKGCTIRLLDEKHQTLEIMAAYGMSRAYLEKGPVHLKNHHIDQRVLKGESVSTKDITSDPHVLYLDEARKEGIKSVLSVPLTVRERAIGVIRVYTAEPHDFTQDEIERVKVFASLGGLLADKARLWQEMKALIEIARSISSTLTQEEVLNKIVRSAAEALGFRAASIRLLDEERKNLEIKATYGLSSAYLGKGPVEIGKSPIDRRCMEGQVVSIPDISESSELQYPEEIMREGIMALLSVPLSLKGSVIGVLRVYTSMPYTFSDREVEFLSALASQGAIAIENARLFEHIRREYDDLTKNVWEWYDWGTRFPKI